MGSHQNPYYFLDTYCLRTPIYPLGFFKGLVQKAGDSRTILKEYWEGPLVREAIFLASDHLHDKLEHYFNNSQLKHDEGLEEAFLKYLIRMSTRCTPFGLFSGVCTATFDQKGGSEKQHLRKTAFDNNFLQALSEKLSRLDSIKNQLPFFTNTTLYKAADHIRYIDYQLKDKGRAYSLEALGVTDHLESTLLLASQGKTIDELANNLVNGVVSFADARRFIDVLIENKLLVSPLELSVTGDDVLSEFIELLRQYEDTNEIVKYLEELANALLALDQNFGNDKSTYESIIGQIETLDVPYERKYLFQTDLSLKRNLALIESKQAYALRRAIPILMKLNPFDEPENLKEFKKAFRRRWEDQEVPLAVALDIESGIGYVQNSGVSNTTPFLHDVTPYAKPSASVSYALNEADQVIYKKLKEAIRENAYCMELTDEDFEGVDEEWNHSPDTLACIVQILHNEQKSMYLSSFTIGAAKLLARFCHCDEGIYELTNEIASLEKSLNPDKILAEIAHLPEARVGNLKRPHLRDTEIPYTAHSTLPKNRQIPLDDLMVSVNGNRIILKSKRLGREVIPMLTNAHNYSAKGLPVYYFLCDLECQNRHQYFGFSWPGVAYDFPFLPSVTYKNIILSRAKWILEETQLEQLIQLKKSDDLLAEINTWRSRHNLLRYVQIGRGDNTLSIDLRESKSIKLMINSIKNKKQLIIEESLLLGTMRHSTSHDVFANELIIPFYNKSKSTF